MKGPIEIEQSSNLINIQLIRNNLTINKRGGQGGNVNLSFMMNGTFI
jgi:hypothetical protein